MSKFRLNQSGVIHVVILLAALGCLIFFAVSSSFSINFSLAQGNPEISVMDESGGKVTSRKVNLKLTYPVPPSTNNLPNQMLLSAQNDNKIDPLIDEQIEDGKQSIPVIIKLKTSFKSFYESGQKAPQGSTKSDEFQKTKKSALSDNTPSVKIKNDLKIVNSVSADVSPQSISELLNNPEVESVVLDQPVEALVADSTSQIKASEVWGLPASGSATLTGYTGKGKTIAILDTGVDYTRPEFGSCEKIGVGPDCRVTGGWNYVNQNLDPKDDHLHGTHVAAIAAGKAVIQKDGKTLYFYGAAPEANIHAYKVLNSFGSGFTSTVLAGIGKAMDPNLDGDTSDHADVINLSIGMNNGNPDDFLSLAVDRATAAGITVVVAAGNTGAVNSINSPGLARTAITVAASCKTFQIGTHKYCTNAIASFSSQGPISWDGIDLQKPDISAPGVLICTSKASIYQSSSNDCIDTSHIQLSGTSMAAPHIAGVAALILQAHPDYSPAQVKQALKLSAKSLGQPYNAQGAGEVVATAAVTGSFPPATPQPTPTVIKPSPLPSPLFPPEKVLASDNFNRKDQTALGKDMQGHKWVSYSTVFNEKSKTVKTNLVNWAVKDKQAQLQCVKNNNKGFIPQSWSLVDAKISDNFQVSVDIKAETGTSTDFWNSTGAILTGHILLPFRVSDAAAKNGNYVKFSYMKSPTGKTFLFDRVVSSNHLAVVSTIKNKSKLIGYLEYDPQSINLNPKGSNNFRYFVINNKLTFYANGNPIIDRVSGKSQIDLTGDNAKGTMHGFEAFTTYNCFPTFKFTNFAVSEISTSLPTHFRVANSKAALTAKTTKAQAFVPDATGAQINIPWTLTAGLGSKTVFVQFKVGGDWRDVISTTVKFEKESTIFKTTD